MRIKLYLASDSKARKRLLSIFGLKFKVVSSGIDEEKKKKGVSYSDLVKRNALKKAETVASRVKSGVVIGADTIVVQSGKIYGKPGNLKDAFAMLKKLSGHSQWVYSGVAVVDKESGKKMVTCEKTKIEMDPLSDEEIKKYFSYVSPLDKAGSFDIQGKGAFFIRRIEGCFYNVVGLPLRTLYRMFKKLRIDVFLAFFYLLPFTFFLLTSQGCSTEYNIVTGEQETYYYSTDKEIKIGESVSREIEKKYKLVEDPLVQERVKAIGERIAAVCDRKDIHYVFKAIQDKEVNAISLPGGYVYVNQGLIDKAANDDELAGVLAHEVGHIVARHSIKKLQGMMSYNLLRLLGTQLPSSGEIGATADIAFTELMLGYSREDELLADRLGARYLKSAGFDPRAMLAFLKKLQEHDSKKPLQQQSYFKTHPHVPDRIRIVKQELGEGMSFEDYINMDTQERKK